MPTTLLLALVLFSVFMLSLASCTVTETNQQQPLPQLLGVVPMPYGVALVGDDSVVHPNGLAYITSRSGYVVVVKGTELVDVIAFPHTEKSRSEPKALVVNPHNGYVYVVDQGINAVHVISGTTVITTMPSLGFAPRFATVNPETGYVYVVNRLGPPEAPRAKNITVFSNTQAIAQVKLNYSPFDIEFNPVDEQIYIGHGIGYANLGEPPGGILTIISDTKLVTTTFLGLTQQDGIVQIAVNQDSGEMYLLNVRTLMYWDGVNPARALPLPDYLFEDGLAVDSKRGWVYAGSWDGPPSHVIVTQQDRIIAEIPVGFDARHIVVDETHDYVYVANRLSGSMSVIHGTEVITTLSTEGVGPSFITVDEERGYIYVSNADFTGSVSIFGFDEPADKPSFWQTFLPWLRK